VKAKVAAALAAMLIVEACSSRPREFAPTLSEGSADQARIHEALATCHDLLVAGKLDRDGRLASGGVGAAAGMAVGVAGTAAATSAGLYAGVAVMSATLVALPFAVVGGAWGMAKIKRHKKEKAIQMAMTGCLHDHGYDVAGWQRMPKKRPPAPAG
jgi:hypothetical protein